MRPPAILSLCPVTDPTRPSQSLLGLLFATDQPGSVGRALTCSKAAVQKALAEKWGEGYAFTKGFQEGDEHEKVDDIR